MKVAPSPWLSLSEQEVSLHRNFNCPLYESCLYLAACEHWDSFTCKFCSMNKLGWTHQDEELMGFNFTGSDPLEGI